MILLKELVRVVAQMTAAVAGEEVEWGVEQEEVNLVDLEGSYFDRGNVSKILVQLISS